MRTRLLAAVLPVAVVLLATRAVGATEPSSSEASPGEIELEVVAGLLTLEARDAPLADVVRAIGERVGFETILDGDLSAPVTTSFAEVPVGDALNRLLGDLNRAIVYGGAAAGGEEAVIVRLSVFGPGRALPEHAAGAVASGVLDALKHGDDGTRAQAALRLANSAPTEEVLAALGETLRGDEDAWVRSRAAAALGSLRDARAVPALEVALADENASVAIQAIQALGGIGGEPAARALGEILLRGEDRQERVHAAWALGRHDTELARSLLDAVADDPDELVRMASESPPGRLPEFAAVPAADDAEQRGSESIR